MKKFRAVLHTNGRGCWSSSARKVTVNALEIGYFDRHDWFGELQVFFNKKDWDIGRHGLIYTDPMFLRELKVALKKAGYNPRDVHYSEQGMQGDTYVSFDVGKYFLKSFFEKKGK